MHPGEQRVAMSRGGAAVVTSTGAGAPLRQSRQARGPEHPTHFPTQPSLPWSQG